MYNYSVKSISSRSRQKFNWILKHCVKIQATKPQRLSSQDLPQEIKVHQNEVKRILLVWALSNICLPSFFLVTDYAHIGSNFNYNEGIPFSPIFCFFHCIHFKYFKMYVHVLNNLIFGILITFSLYWNSLLVCARTKETMDYS